MQLVNDEDPFKDVYTLAIIMAIFCVLAASFLVYILIKCLI